MGEKKKYLFDVYLLDVYKDEFGWTENERYKLGRMEVEPIIGSELDCEDIIEALRHYTYQDMVGIQHNALNTSDRRRVYAEDYYGDGEWWEVGTVKERMPVFGLARVKETA